MADKVWKATERAIAGRLGGERLPINGRGRQPDVMTTWLACEVKHRRQLPAWLLTAMRQAVAGAGPSQLPIAVLHQLGQRHDSDLVVLRLGDFCGWFGELGTPGDTETPRQQAETRGIGGGGNVTNGTCEPDPPPRPERPYLGLGRPELRVRSGV